MVSVGDLNEEGTLLAGSPGPLLGDGLHTNTSGIRGDAEGGGERVLPHGWTTVAARRSPAAVTKPRRAQSDQGAARRSCQPQAVFASSKVEGQAVPGSSCPTMIASTIHTHIEFGQVIMYVWPSSHWLHTLRQLS